MTKLLLKIEEACEALGIGRSHLYAMMTAGELPYVKIGKARRIRVSDLNAYVEKLIAKTGGVK